MIVPGWAHVQPTLSPLVRASRDLEILWSSRDSSRMNTCTLHPLLEYPEILRYFDHSEMVPGWVHAHRTPLSEHFKIPRYPDHPRTVPGWTHAHALHPLVTVSWDPEILRHMHYTWFTLGLEFNDLSQSLLLKELIIIPFTPVLYARYYPGMVRASQNLGILWQGV